LPGRLWSPKKAIRFAWLDKAVELAARISPHYFMHPTPTPPVWLGEKHPESFLVRADGLVRTRFTRKQRAADPSYLRYTERIITELGRRYGQNPNIWGWQLDNEPNSQPDYSPSAQEAFSENGLRTVTKRLMFES